MVDVIDRCDDDNLLVDSLFCVLCEVLCLCVFLISNQNLLVLIKMMLARESRVYVVRRSSTLYVVHLVEIK